MGRDIPLIGDYMRRSNFAVYTVGVSPVLIAGASPSRRVLTITTNGASCVISPDQKVANPNGLLISVGQVPTVLCCEYAGDWLTHDIYASAPAGTAHLYVISAFDSWEDYLIDQERARRHGEKIPAGTQSFGQPTP